jgi:hypothetical protein
LDFVKKRWQDIRRLLDYYGEKQPAIRRRPKAARDTFIWEHRDVPSEELKEMVHERFPGESLEYFEINSIKRRMRKRHSEK